MMVDMVMEQPVDELIRDPHNEAIEAVLTRLKVSPATGLSNTQITSRQGKFGPNRLKGQKPRPAWMRFLDQFNNVLIYVLIAAAFTTALLEHWIDTSVIIGVVLINAVIGHVQEGKAEDALRAVRKMLTLKAHAIRNSIRTTIDAEVLVPGDIVLLAAGDRVPADLRILEANGLQIDEAVLTGEADQVEKCPDPVPQSAPLGDRKSMAYASTLVTSGSGKAVVTATGSHTEIGQIGTLLSEVESVDTPLLRQMSIFARWLTIAILVFAVLTFLFGVFVRGFSTDEMFLAAVGLAVAAIPEGLPAVMSITLAIGVSWMARHKAIIRRLPAVETLGSVTVICSDKTGTLTRNELMAQTVVTAGEKFHVTGSGYTPHGSFLMESHTVDPGDYPELMRGAQAAALCNDAELIDMATDWQLEGNPTDGALLAVAMKTGLNVAHARSSNKRIHHIPFDSSHKIMATLHEAENNNKLIVVKGAPERILEMCNFQYQGEQSVDLAERYWLDEIDKMTNNAERVLAVAYRDADQDAKELKFSDIESGLTLLIIIGIIDPPRSEAIEAIATCRAAGIDVNMITGDHISTARAIGRSFGLGEAGGSVTGQELDEFDEAEFRSVVRNCDIFARTTPKHKLRIVEALQSDGAVVAVTGDGVNDAPALKRADIGIAMGCKGTEAAKEAARMVLADDNFASIVRAIKVGRTIYENLVKTILFILPTSLGEAATVIVAVLFGLSLPVAPVQILWINMLTATTLGLALAVEREEGDVMTRPPRDPGAPIFSTYLVWRIVLVSVLLLICAFGLFEWMRHLGAGLDEARTAAVNALVAGEIANLINCRRMRNSCLNWSGLTGNIYVTAAISVVIVLQLIFTYTPIMNTLFHTAPLKADVWPLIAVCALGVFLIVELEKYLVARFLN